MITPFKKKLNLYTYYVLRRPLLLIAVLPLGYLVLWLFRLLISANGGIENHTVDSSPTHHNAQNPPANGESVMDVFATYTENLQKLVVQGAGCTDRYGVVFEDNFSTDVQNLISQDAAIKKAYLEYRQKVWDRYQENRLDPAFDAFWYNPNQSNIINTPVTKDDSTQTTPTPQGDDAP